MHTGETVHFVLMLFLTPISFGAFGAVVWWFLRQHNDTTEAGNVEQVWAKRTEWGEATCRRIINRQVTAGMSPEMVTLAWGQPSRVEPQPGGGEVWRFEAAQTGQPGGEVVFRQGVVAEASGQPPGSGRSSGRAAWLIIAATLVLALIVSVITLVVIAVVGS
ncbi:MAG: hypothetical protein Kow0031_04700 [Anaerolineae bacterium]